MKNPQNPPSEARQLADFIGQHPRLVVLTGAGISLQSGIPTYRDRNGVWLGSAPMQHQDFITHEHIRSRYWARSFIGRSTIAAAQPNPAHFALARLEAGGFVELLITQNVDNLHQRAGSRHVIDLHGNLRDIHCLDCAERSSRDELQQRIAELNPHLQGLMAEIRPDGDAILDEAHIRQVRIPECTRCGGVLMPEVVFFGGTVPVTRVQYCLDALQRADALLVVGSSLKVYSGYRFCLRAKEWDKPIALINPGITRADPLAALHLKSDSSTLLAQTVKLMAV
ncbi:MAG: NAD-dependent protein deacetylase [Thiolinea sp.]